MGCGIRCVVPVLLAALALAAPAAAQSPATAAAEPEALARAREAVTAAVRAAVADLDSDAFDRRAAAQALLEAVAALPVEAVLAETGGGSEEQRVRVEPVFRAARRQARLAELLWRLPSPERQAVRALGERKPAAFAAFFGDDREGIEQAMQELVRPDEPAAAALLAWAVDQPHRNVYFKAAELAAGIDAPSALLRDALYRRLEMLNRLVVFERGLRFARMIDYGFGGTEPDGNAEVERLATLVALCRLHDGRVLADLAEELPKALPDGDRQHLMDAAAEMEVEGLVPLLMDRIARSDVGDGPGRRIGTTDDGIPVTQKPIDAFLWVVLIQAEQQPADHGFVVAYRDSFILTGPVPAEFLAALPVVRGFPDDQTRQRALRKLLTWWAEHRHEYPAEPLPVGEE